MGNIVDISVTIFGSPGVGFSALPTENERFVQHYDRDADGILARYSVRHGVAELVYVRYNLIGASREGQTRGGRNMGLAIRTTDVRIEENAIEKLYPFVIAMFNDAMVNHNILQKSGETKEILLHQFGDLEPDLSLTLESIKDAFLQYFKDDLIQIEGDKSYELNPVKIAQKLKEAEEQQKVEERKRAEKEARRKEEERRKSLLEAENLNREAKRLAASDIPTPEYSAETEADRNMHDIEQGHYSATGRRKRGITTKINVMLVLVLVVVALQVMNLMRTPEVVTGASVTSEQKAEVKELRKKIKKLENELEKMENRAQKAENKSSASRSSSGNDNASRNVGETQIHVVQSGETPSAIAIKYGISLDSLAKLNPAKEDRLKKGQVSLDEKLLVMPHSEK